MIQNHIADPNGRFLFLNVHIEGEPFTLASFYAPNDNSVAFVASSLKSLDSFRSGPIIAGGDFNFCQTGQWTIRETNGQETMTMAEGV